MVPDSTDVLKQRIVDIECRTRMNFGVLLGRSSLYYDFCGKTKTRNTFLENIKNTLASLLLEESVTMQEQSTDLRVASIIHYQSLIVRQRGVIFDYT